MVQLCTASGDSIEIRCSQVNTFQSAVSTFLGSKTNENYIDMIEELASTASNYNAFTTLFEAEGDAEIINKIASGGVRTVTRGGVESNITVRFDAFPDGGIERVRNATEALNHRFEEIIFVSDGLAGSAAAMTPYQASQLAKNGATTQKVSLVAYGGTGAAEDLTTSSFPASVQGVHHEYSVIGKAATSM